MPDKKPRSGDQRESHEKTENTSGQLMRHSERSLVEGAEPPKVNHQSRYQDEPPKSMIGRWFWKYTQVILSALTFLVLIVYGAQLWQARETRELENRAYVIVKSVGFVQAPDNPGLSYVVVTITNTGKTPGLNGTTIIHTEGRDTPIPEGSGFPPLDSPPSRTVLAPQIDAAVKIGPFPNVLGERIAQAAASPPQGQSPPKNAATQPPVTAVPVPQPTPDKKYSYLYGVITYDDVFGHPHQTTFCFFNTPRTSEWVGCSSFNSFN